MGEEVGVEARAEGATAIVVGPLLAWGQAVGGRREKEEAAGDDVMELSVDVAAQHSEYERRSVKTLSLVRLRLQPGIVDEFLDVNDQRVQF